MDISRELTVREVNILLALAAGESSGYRIVRQCHDDTAGDVSLSNGTVFPALKRLEKLGAVEMAGGKGTLGRRMDRPDAKVYRLTRLGRQLLELQLASYRRMVRLGQVRI